MRLQKHRDGRCVYQWKGAPGAKRLTTKSRCGVLLDRLLKVLASKPAYLHPADRARYAVLIPKLKAFRITHGWGEDARSVRVAQLPVSRLGSALESWIYAALRNGEGTLTPAFVLDAARFIEAHAYGRMFYEGGDGAAWDIAPMVSHSDPQERWIFELGQDKQLKGRVTSSLKDLIVRFTVPAGSSLVDRYTGQVAPGPLECFGSVQRCHLSQGFFDVIAVEAREEAPLQHDVALELELLVRLRPREEVEALMSAEPFARYALLRESGPELMLPGRWITAALVWPGERRGSAPVWESSRDAWERA